MNRLTRLNQMNRLSQKIRLFRLNLMIVINRMYQLTLKSRSYLKYLIDRYYLLIQRSHLILNCLNCLKLKIDLMNRLLLLIQKIQKNH